jgi:DnaJ-domain-containing protein 1
MWVALLAWVHELLLIFFGADVADNATGAGSGSSDNAGWAPPPGGSGGDHRSGRKPAPTESDPFEVLGLAAKGIGVTPIDVRRAYRKLALKFHPDKVTQSGLDPKEAEEKMKEVSSPAQPCPCMICWR